MSVTVRIVVTDARWLSVKITCVCIKHNQREFLGQNRSAAYLCPPIGKVILSYWLITRIAYEPILCVDLMRAILSLIDLLDRLAVLLFNVRAFLEYFRKILFT